jgi:hypothetical protein
LPFFVTARSLDRKEAIRRINQLAIRNQVVVDYESRD